MSKNIIQYVKKSVNKKIILKCIFYTVISVILPLVYYHFSHNRTSIYMSLCFLVPLFALILIMIFRKHIYEPAIFTSSLAVWFAMVLMAVFEIAGTESWLILILLSFGVIIFVLAFIIPVLRSHKDMIK